MSSLGRFRGGSTEEVCTTIYVLLLPLLSSLLLTYTLPSPAFAEALSVEYDSPYDYICSADDLLQLCRIIEAAENGAGATALKVTAKERYSRQKCLALRYFLRQVSEVAKVAMRQCAAGPRYNATSFLFLLRFVQSLDILKAAPARKPRPEQFHRGFLLPPLAPPPLTPTEPHHDTNRLRTERWCLRIRSGQHPQGGRQEPQANRLR